MRSPATPPSTRSRAWRSSRRWSRRSATLEKQATTAKEEAAKTRAAATAAALNDSLALVTGHKAARTSKAWNEWIKAESKKKKA